MRELPAQNKGTAGMDARCYTKGVGRTMIQRHAGIVSVCWLESKIAGGHVSNKYLSTCEDSHGFGETSGTTSINKRSHVFGLPSFGSILW